MAIVTYLNEVVLNAITATFIIHQYSLVFFQNEF